MEDRFVVIPEKDVEFEEGRIESVPSFKIARLPVSIGEFRAVAEQYQYVTTAERNNRSGETYLNNEALTDTPKDRVDHLPARYLSWNDALFFCESTGFRLPSESEWLAAAMVDPDVYDRAEWKQAIPRVAEFPQALQWLSREYTANMESEDQVVVRSGPKFVRRSDWRERAHAHRFLASRTGGDALIQFRVCER